MSIMCVRISEELYSPSIGEELANDGKRATLWGPGSFSSVFTYSNSSQGTCCECYSLTTSHVVCHVCMHAVCNKLKTSWVTTVKLVNPSADKGKLC